jgi:hypothetical protein
MLDFAVWFYTSLWRLFLAVGRVGNSVVAALVAAGAWWQATFGTSDVLERPDASVLAARSAGHAYIGYKSVELIGRHMAPWLALLLLAVMYGVWEWSQWARDPARFKRRVARRWDILSDFSAVWLLGGVGFQIGRSGTDASVWAFSVVSVAVILGSAAIMGRNYR